MRKRFRLLPFDAIREDPLLFVLWVSFAVGLGLVGFWLPMFLQAACDPAKVGDVLRQLIGGGVLPSFGVVFVSSSMAESLVGTRTNLGEDTTTALSKWRAIVIVACTVVMLMQGGLLSRGLSDDKSGRSQWILFGISIFLGVSLYCFRYYFGESLDDGVREENAETKHLGETAKKATKDSSGVNL